MNPALSKEILVSLDWSGVLFGGDARKVAGLQSGNMGTDAVLWISQGCDRKPRAWVR